MQRPRTLPCEEELVEACRAGKVEAYEHLYRSHGVRMKSIACNILGNMSDAEDAVQETFLKIYRSVHGFRRRAAFTTWIYRVLVNTCRDQMRRARRQRQGMDANPIDAGKVHSAAGTPDHPLRIALETALARLLPRDRMVFVLHEVEGFRHREIAEILEIPEGTSKNTLFIAKNALQEILRSSAAGVK